MAKISVPEILLASLLLGACTGGDPGKGADSADGTDGADGSDGTDGSDGSDGSDGEDTGTDATGDEALLRAAIAGEAEAETTLREIALSGGLPVRTEDGGYLFACLCGDGDWKLAGDHEGWVGEPMTRAGDLWWIEVEIDAPTDSRYKLTDGAQWIADPFGRRFNFDENGLISYVEADVAHLERFYDLPDNGGPLEPRDLQVWVPQGGAFTHLLIAHDGQNLFDPAAIWGGWQLQASLPANMLVVGIDNSFDRMDEYTHTTDVIGGDTVGGRAAEYDAFIEDTVFPLVSAQYGDAQVTGTMGSSLGGLISFVLADMHPDRYAMAISLSGTMGWGSIGRDGETIIDRYRDAGHRPTALYLDSGGGGTCWDADGDGLPDDDPGSADNYCENAYFRDVLADELGYTFDEDLWHWHEPGAEHNEAAWASRVWRPLEIFAGL